MAASDNGMAFAARVANRVVRSIPITAPIAARLRKDGQPEARSKDWPTEQGLILHGYFGGEQKSRAAVVELDQQHMTAKIIDLADDQRLFGKAAAA
jgi:hypothetical protein